MVVKAGKRFIYFCLVEQTEVINIAYDGHHCSDRSFPGILVT